MKPKKARETRKCIFCNKDFIVIITSKKKFCSHKCVLNYQKGKNNPNFGNHPIPWNKGLKGVNGNCGAPKGVISHRKGERKYKFNCMFCNKFTKTSDYRSKFCSKECYFKYNRGVNHFNFGNWSRDYDRDFNNKLKKMIRFRDNYNCQICGKHQNLFSKKLQVHHIDYDKYNSVNNNLISLCVYCHGKTNYNRKEWEKYFNKKIKDRVI